MKHSTGLRILTLLALSLFTFAGHAEVLQLNDNGVRVIKPANAPVRGMHRATVLKRFGKPLRRSRAVGNPPISRWDYPGYTVYFERNIVLHSVAHKH